VETLLLEDDYASYFANELSVPTMYDFSDERGAKIDMGISICDNCEASYIDEQLTITNENEADEPATCIPYDEYLRAEIGREENLSSVSLCVDVSAIVDPHLVFSIRQEDVEDEDELINGYLHLADVYAGTTALLNEPITTTGGEMQDVEIPLPAGYVGDISLYLLTTQTTTTLDNIGITSGAPSPTRRLTAGDFRFTYPNPVRESLELRANLPLPANTTVRLLAADGREISSQTMPYRETLLDLSAQPAGLYFLSVSFWAGPQVQEKVFEEQGWRYHHCPLKCFLRTCGPAQMKR